MLAKDKSLTEIDVNIVRPCDDHVPAFYRTFHCESENVREALAPEVEHWTSRDPTLVVAPPGMGKTTLACEELLPQAVKHGKNVLFVLNRVGLATQLKLRVLETLKSPMKRYLTAEGLSKTEKFGCACVITYHGLPAFINDPTNQDWIRNLMFVVADEIHFIAADSFFNERCGYYLKLLTQKFQHAVRVYMTATEWDVLVPLAEAEKENNLDSMKIIYPWLRPREFRRYVFPANYSHIDLLFFKDLGEIRERIEANPHEKWIVFMDSKKAGKAFAKDLRNRSIYLDADSKETKEWYQLLSENCFQQQVLVTTAVLDCGVNVIDRKLRNVVIFSDDRTRLIQMLGRKRCIEGERVNLFVYDIDEKTIAKRYNDGEHLCQWLERYTRETQEGRSKMAHEIWHSEDEDLKLYFDLAKGHLIPNYVAFFALKRKRNFYRSLVNEEVTFQQAVRSWMGLSEEGEVVESHVNLQEKLFVFCEEHLEHELTDEEISALREMVITIADQVGIVKTRADRLESIGKDALNKRMETFKCPYRVARNAWRIEKIKEE